MQGTARDNAGGLEAKKVFFFFHRPDWPLPWVSEDGLYAAIAFFLTSQPAFFTYYNLKYPSLRKQTTFCNATNGFSAKWRLRNERRNSILMTCHYPDLGSASDWLKQTSHALCPFRNTTQIWVVTRHQYGISALVFSDVILRGNRWWRRKMSSVFSRYKRPSVIIPGFFIFVRIV